MSIFVISLDLELGWGFILDRQNKTFSLFKKQPQLVRQKVQLLLRLFEKYQIPATFAVAGHLFLDSNNDEMITPELPQFQEGFLDWDDYLQLGPRKLYCAKDIVANILSSTVEHEIGLHGFFHIPFTQCSREVAEAEIVLGQKVAQRAGVSPVSFVFPQNKIAHLSVLQANGIQIYRGRSVGEISSLGRALPKKVVSLNKSLAVLPVSLLRKGENFWEISGSMEFYNSRLPFLVSPRARLGVKLSIMSGKIFHLWLHPWSLAARGQLLQELENILLIVARAREKGNLKAGTMKTVIQDYAHS